MLYLGISIKVLRVSLVIGLQKRFTQLYNYVNLLSLEIEILMEHIDRDKRGGHA